MKLLYIILPSLLLMSSPIFAIDKIFMSQSERNVLNKMRKHGDFIKNKKTEVLKSVRLDGLVFKAGKKSIVFINGVSSLNDRKVSNEIHVRTKNIDPKKAKVLVTKNKSSRYMKPGQVWLSPDVNVIEAYQYRHEK